MYDAVMHDASKVVNPESVDAWQLQGATPRRIAVIGQGGAGKTTVALRLGRELGLPVIHLDRLYWGPGWRPVGREVFGERQAAVVAGDAWVIDGGYCSSDGWETRIERADLVVLVEAPLAVCLGRILRRPLSRSRRRRPDLPDGCDEAFSLFFLRWTLGWHRRNAEVLARIERTRPVVRVAQGRPAPSSRNSSEGGDHAQP